MLIGGFDACSSLGLLFIYFFWWLLRCIWWWSDGWFRFWVGGLGVVAGWAWMKLVARLGVVDEMVARSFLGLPP